MWRFAVAAALLMVLVFLVADMLFGGNRSLGTVDRYPPPPAWYGAERDALLVGRSSAIDIGKLPTASGSSSADLSFDPDALGDDVGIDAEPEASVLARRPNAGEEEPWPGQVPLLPPALPNPQKQLGDDPPPPRKSDAVRPHPTPSVAAPAPRSLVIEAQRRLAALGYEPGPADGHPGRRTDAAVRDFQRDSRQAVTGRIDGELLAHLETKARMREHLRQQELEAMSPAPAPKAERPTQDRSVFGSVLGGVQRLMGRDFDSVRKPEELASYCRGNAETWIYDFGREAFVYCGNVLTGQTASTGAEGTIAGR